MMRRTINILFILVLLILPELSSGQKLSVETSLDTNRIVLGDQVWLRYVIDRQNDVQVKIPDFPDTLIGGVEKIGAPVIDSTKLDKENWRINIELLITSFDTGIYYIPPQPIAFSDDQIVDTLQTRPTYLEVFGVALDTTNTVRDIKGQARMPLSLVEILLYLLPLLILGAIIFVVVKYVIPKKSEAPAFKPAKPEEPAYITALRELDRIKAQKLWQQKKVKAYYSGITHIIRWYIEKRYRVKALEQTSDEILQQMKNQAIDEVNLNNLENLLTQADLVKFAKAEPNPEDNITHLDNSYDFIKKTKQEAVESEQEKPAAE